MSLGPPSGATLDMAGSSSESIDSTPTRVELNAGGDDKKISDAYSGTDDTQEHINDQVLNLARKYTTQSIHASHQNPFAAEKDGPLDPNGPNFEARAWAKAFFNMRSSNAAGSPSKSSGVAFKNLNVYGFGTDTDFQKSVGNIFFEGASLVRKVFGTHKNKIDILSDIEGLLRQGEMLAVLGPPGSGCSTMLRTIAGETHGFHISQDSAINYQGIHPKEMHDWFRGEAVYTAEVDAHFPMLTVGDTLYFAALARAPSTIPGGVSRSEYATHLRDVIMAMFGISHTINTRVGDDYVRGVSGGERKRVTIAEATLSYAPLQCWDNSTRGLDSANALEFCRTLRTQSDIMNSTACVAIYQASQDAYDVSRSQVFRNVAGSDFFSQDF